MNLNLGELCTEKILRNNQGYATQKSADSDNFFINRCTFVVPKRYSVKKIPKKFLSKNPEKQGFGAKIPNFFKKNKKI